MEQVVLNVTRRKELKKSACKALRKQGYVPCVVYGEGEESIAVRCLEKELLAALHTGAGRNVILTLKVADDAKEPEKTVIIKEVQYHPVRADVVHVDFNSISLTEVIRVEVPVVIKGEAKGAKEGGILEHVMWQLDVECLPTQVPSKFEVDVSSMEMGATLHVKDLPLPQGVKVLNDPDLIVLSVAMPKAVVAEEAAVEEAAGPAEPEVITQRKEKEEAEEEEEQEEKKEKK